MSFELAYSIIVPTLTIIALLYAGFEDIFYREVRRDIVWILMVIFGLVLDILYLIFSDAWESVLLEMLLTIFVAFIFGFIFVYFGLWGGADTKALWALSILTPIHPFTANIFGEIQNYFLINTMVFSLLINSGILVIFYPLALIAFNTIAATRGTLFDEVRATTSQKIRCFLFGYKKEVAKINAKKLHFDFLEAIAEREFEGSFEGVFEGRLDGKFVGYINGDFSGELSGKAVGLFSPKLEKEISEFTKEEIIQKAMNIAASLEKKNEFDEIPNIVLQKYRQDNEIEFSTNKNTIDLSEEQILVINGKSTLPLKGDFLGIIEGIFEGKIDCSLIGKLEGDFQGTSSKGKLSGTKDATTSDWQIKIRMRMEDEEDLMEQRQLRTLWQLNAHNKKTVWVMPGLPFVFFMLIGYILYLLFGNIILQLFALII